MRISGKVLSAICACHAVTGGNAFLGPSAETKTTDTGALHSSYYNGDGRGGVGVMDRPRNAPPLSEVHTYRPDERRPANLPRYEPDNKMMRVGAGGAPVRQRVRPGEMMMPNLSQQTDADRYNRQDPYSQNPRNQWWESGQTIGGRGRTIQGSTRSTVGVPYGSQRSEVYLETEGRPLDTEVELWDGPNNTPTKMKVYSEDGRLRPFRAFVENPSRSGSSTMSIRNSGPMEFPISANVGADMSMRAADSGRPGFASSRRSSSSYALMDIQGGSLKTWSLDADVGSAEVTIETDGLPMYAVVELWGTGGHVKQLAEIYNDDGFARPFSAIVETPGGANTICIKNKGPIAYPMKASVEPASTESFNSYDGYGYGGAGMYGGRPYELPYSIGASYNWNEGNRPFDSSYYNAYNNRAWQF